MANLALERFQTGNHVRVFASGQGQKALLGVGEVGELPEGTNLTVGANTGARPIHVIGSAEPQDIVDAAHTYQITLALLRLRDREAADVINAAPIDIEVVDFEGKRVQTAEECHLVNGDLQVPANNPVARNLTFQAMRVS